MCTKSTDGKWTKGWLAKTYADCPSDIQQFIEEHARKKLMIPFRRRHFEMNALARELITRVHATGKVAWGGVIPEQVDALSSRLWPRKRIFLIYDEKSSIAMTFTGQLRESLPELWPSVRFVETLEEADRSVVILTKGVLDGKSREYLQKATLKKSGIHPEYIYVLKEDHAEEAWDWGLPSTSSASIASSIYGHEAYKFRSSECPPLRYEHRAMVLDLAKRLVGNAGTSCARRVSLLANVDLQVEEYEDSDSEMKTTGDAEAIHDDGGSGSDIDDTALAVVDQQNSPPKKIGSRRSNKSKVDTNGAYRMKVSTTGPENTLPSFFFMAKSEEGGSLFKGFYDPPYEGGRGEPNPFEVPVNNCPDDLFDNTSPDLRVPQLPWALQDDWGCERETKDVSTIILESKSLRASVTPQWGGKVWSLYHKGFDRELLFANPAHQPANIGYRKAWSSGGAEWNWAPGKIGHSVFTESPVYAARLDTEEEGEILRVFEYDRLNGTLWQVDMFVDDDGVFWAHPKVRNFNNVSIPGYWWTCVANKVEDSTRIVTPAQMSVTPCSDWPYGAWTLRNTSFKGTGDTQHECDGRAPWQQDMSYLGNIPTSHDFFMHHLDRNVVPHITHVSPDGFSLVHSHPEWMNGTKFFEWGMNEYGIFQQDFLSASDYENEECDSDVYDPYCPAYVHEGRYTELQVGPAATQMHVFPVPAHGHVEWTEWFKAFQGNVTRLHSTHYEDALDEVREYIDSDDGVSSDRIQEVDTFFEMIADRAPSEVLTPGMPWGGLAEMQRGKNFSACCPFTHVPYDKDTMHWIDLIRLDGNFSKNSLNATPITFEVGVEWMSLLKDGETWLHHLFRGTQALEVGDAPRARTEFEASVELRPNPHAFRNMAVMSPTADLAWQHYQNAWSSYLDLSDQDAVKFRIGKDLAREIAPWLMLNERWEDLRGFLKSLPDAYASKDRVLHALAALHVHDGNFMSAKKILRANCFPTYGSERSALIELWWSALVLEAEASKDGTPLTKRELLALQRKYRCHGDSATSTLNDPCILGPPNLGYAY
eukprot:g3040.t1